MSEFMVNKGDIPFLIREALMSEAFAARMYGDNPELSEDAQKAYRWAEEQFLRIYKGNVSENDICG